MKYGLVKFADRPTAMNLSEKPSCYRAYLIPIIEMLSCKFNRKNRCWLPIKIKGRNNSKMKGHEQSSEAIKDLGKLEKNKCSVSWSHLEIKYSYTLNLSD